MKRRRKGAYLMSEVALPKDFVPPVASVLPPPLDVEPSKPYAEITKHGWIGWSIVIHDGMTMSLPTPFIGTRRQADRKAIRLLNQWSNPKLYETHRIDPDG